MKRILCMTLVALLTLAVCVMPASAEEAQAAIKVGLTEGNDAALKLFEAYTAETGIEIELIEIPNTGDYYTKLALMLQSEDTAPDVMYEDGFMVKSDAAAGYLAPLDDYLAEWEDWSQYTGAMQETGLGLDGKVYAVIAGTDVQVIWYNTDTFEAAGLDPNWEPKTWDDVLETAKVLKESNADNPDFVPMYQWTSSSLAEATSMRTFQLLYAGLDGQCYDYDNSKWVVDKPKFKQVLEFVNKAWNEYELCSYDLASLSDPDTEVTGNLMPAGNIGLFCGGSWVISSWAEGGTYEWDALQEGKVRFAFFPTADGEGKTTVSGGWTWAIPALASNKDGGWELIKWLCSASNAAQYCVDSGNLPGREDAWQEEVWLNQPNADLVANFQESLSFTTFRDAVNDYNTVSVLYAQMVENVGFGIMSVDEAVDNFLIELNAAVGEDQVTVIE